MKARYIRKTRKIGVVVRVVVAAAGLAAAGGSVRADVFQWNTQLNDQSWNDPVNWLADGLAATGLPGTDDDIGDPIDLGVPPHGSKVRLTGAQQVNNFNTTLVGGWGIISGNTAGSLQIRGDFSRAGAGSFYFGNSVVGLDADITTASALDVEILGGFLGGSVNFGNSNRALNSVIVHGKSVINATVTVNSPNAQFLGGLELSGNGGVFISLGSSPGGISAAYLSSVSAGTQQIAVANLAGTRTGTLTLTGDTGTWDYSGELRNANGANNSTNTLHVVKTGSNTQILSRAQGQVYSGSTTVAAGTLLVNNTSGSGLGTGSAEVRSGAVLGGTGAIALGGLNTLTIESGGILSPGVGIGNLRLSGSSTAGAILTLENGSNIQFDLAAGNQSDSLTFLNYTGSADFVRGGTTLNFAGAQEGTYTLFRFYSDNGTTAIAAGFDGLNSSFVLGSGLEGYSAAWDYTETGAIKLTLSAVPEPSAIWLAAGGVILLLRGRNFSI